MLLEIAVVFVAGIVVDEAARRAGVPVKTYLVNKWRAWFHKSIAPKV